MKNLKKHVFLWLFTVLVILLPQAAFAIAFPVNPVPLLQSSGTFAFDGTTLSSTETVDQGTYVLKSGDTLPDIFNSTGTWNYLKDPAYQGPTDTIYGATVTVSATYDYTDHNAYNDGTYDYNLHYFTGGTITIMEGAVTYLSGTLPPMVFQQEVTSGVVNLNPFADTVNILNVGLDMTTGSRFITEFEDQSLHGFGRNRPAGSEIFGALRMNFTVTGGSADFSLGGASGTDNSWIYSAVPEPSSLVLILSGLAGLVGFSKRRRLI